MANAFIISEYKREGQKQLLLEKLQGAETGYRVILLKRCASLDAAKQVFLAEIPENRKDYYNRMVEGYAAQHCIKTTAATPTKKQLKLTPAKKEKQNDQSKRKGA